MRTGKRVAACILSVLMTVSMLCSCAKKEEQTGSTIKVSVCDAQETLDPAKVEDIGAQSIVDLLFEGLMRYIDDGSGNAVLQNGVAEGYQYTQNDDGTVTYTFSLRPNAKWSDGRRVTADDFVFAWRRLANPETEAPQAELLAAVKGFDEVQSGGSLENLGVAAKNSSTFSVTLMRACPDFLSSTCASTACVPLREDALTRTEKQDAEDLSVTDKAETDKDAWAKRIGILTNGPYYIETWDKDEKITLKRSEHYYDEHLAQPSEVTFVFAEPEEAADLLKRGKVDYAAPVYQSDDFDLEDYAIIKTNLCTTYCVIFNHACERFCNAEVRYVFSCVIDREEIAQLAGMKAAVGLVPHGISNGDGNVKEFYELSSFQTAKDAQNTPAARLAETGYFEWEDLPALHYLYVQSERNDAVAKALCEKWGKELSVEVAPEGVEQSEYDTRIGKGNFELAGMLYEMKTDDAYGLLRMFKSSDSRNALRYAVGVYDILLGVTEAAADVTARTAFLHDAENMLIGQSAVLPLYYGTSEAASVKNLHGVCRDHFGHIYFAVASKK